MAAEVPPSEPGQSAAVAENAAADSSAPRFAERYSHISVGLRFFGEEGEWHAIRALGWNERGFNFYSAHALAHGTLRFKRGLTPFEGSVVWTARHNEPGELRTMLVNELLFHKTREMLSQPALHARLVRLLRAPLLTEEKRQILSSLGVDTSDATLERMLAQRHLDQTTYRYGVRVASEVWTALVENALKMSSVVLALEKMTAALGPQQG